MPTLPFPSNPSLDVSPPSDNQRTVWNIVWSCLVTIFACTWLAVHPNIPAASDSRVIIALRRLGLMMGMLIIPEVIILWAMRQWYGARKIAKAHIARGWTSTHGFFLQMGGFMLYSDGKALYPLQLAELEHLHQEGEIDWPTITEEEIQDRSKGDALSKGLVILQTSWFLVQCIMRGIKGLVITELELVTLAFAALNTVTYFFWWNKPIDVRWPLAVHRKSSQVAGGQTAPSDSLIKRSGDLLHSIQGLFRSIFKWLVRLLSLMTPGQFRAAYVIAHLYFPTANCLRLFCLIIGIIGGKGTRSSRVPTLHAVELSPDPDIFFFMSVASSAIGVFFGAIHCIAWSFQFPSPREQALWRVSSLVITCAPLLIVVLSVMFSRQRGVDLFGLGALISEGIQEEASILELEINAHVSHIGTLTSDSRTSIDTDGSDLPPLNAGIGLADNRLIEATPYNDDTNSLASEAKTSVDIDGSGLPPLATAIDLADNKLIEAISRNDDNNSLASNAGTLVVVDGSGLQSRCWEFILFLRKGVGVLLQWLFKPCRIGISTSLRLTIPLFTALAHILFEPCMIGSSTSKNFLFKVIWLTLQRTILLFTILAYIAARFTLLVQAFIALRDISPSALEAVEWTSFLPHF